MKEYEENTSQRSKPKDMFYEQKKRDVSGTAGDKYSREYPPTNYEGQFNIKLLSFPWLSCL